MQLERITIIAAMPLTQSDFNSRPANYDSICNTIRSIPNSSQSPHQPTTIQYNTLNWNVVEYNSEHCSTTGHSLQQFAYPCFIYILYLICILTSEHVIFAPQFPQFECHEYCTPALCSITFTNFLLSDRHTGHIN